MSFATTLLGGAAICALCAAPALAAPSIHLAGADTAMTMKVGTAGHVKTGASPFGSTAFTETLTFTGTLTTATFHNPTLVWGETWQDTTTCLAPPHEKGVFKQKTAVAKISDGTSTGNTTACPDTTFTFYGPVYDLQTKTATSDSFSGYILARHYSGYNLTLNVHTDLTITK
jgi:opacity protein-like surface antigen